MQSIDKEEAGIMMGTVKKKKKLEEYMWKCNDKRQLHFVGQIKSACWLCKNFLKDNKVDNIQRYF